MGFGVVGVWSFAAVHGLVVWVLVMFGLEKLHGLEGQYFCGIQRLLGGLYRKVVFDADASSKAETDSRAARIPCD